MTPSVMEIRAGIDERAAARPAFDLLMAHAAAAGFDRDGEPDADGGAVVLRSPALPGVFYRLRVRPTTLELIIRAPRPTTAPDRNARTAITPVSERDDDPTVLTDCADVDVALDRLRTRKLWPSHRAAKRFTADTFAPVSARHLLRAARALLANDGGINGGFGPSKDYDVVVDGQRFAPKALFGLAATDALGFPVRAENFVGGRDTPCFRILREHGYPTVAKGQPIEGDEAQTVEERMWAEGRTVLVTHLRRERATGLAAAKREEMRTKLGRLICQRCGFDPVAAFGSPVGEACIEVHHSVTPVADMNSNHLTSLGDLECLCANCHRVAHRQLKIAHAFS